MPIMSPASLDRLVGATDARRREMLLQSRPAAPDIRIIWWADVVEHLQQRAIDDASSDERARDITELAAAAVDLAEEVADLTAVDAAILSATIADRLWNARPSIADTAGLDADSLTRRLLAAISLRPEQVPDALALEREWYQRETDDARRSPDGPALEQSAEVAALDDLRRLLRPLRLCAPRVADERLVAAVRVWLDLEPVLAACPASRSPFSP